jgi:tripartite-type tricarboxylate transporter receptor subunit TctC
MDARKLRSGVLLAALVLGATATSDAAENWPERSVRLLVPFASGSSPDVAARLYADRLARAWHQPVIVENRPGAEGLVCAAAFAGMRNDHALLFSPAAPISVFPFTHASLGYDPTRDFVPIARAIDTFGVIAVTASLKAGSLDDLVALARARPGSLNWTDGGGAFPVLLAGFARAAGLDMAHVSHRDQNLAIQDLAEGRIEVMATTLTPLMPALRSGKVRLLAVTNNRRAPIVPQVPTTREAGYPGLEFEGLVGFFGGRDMPPALSDRISANVRSVAADPMLVERLAAAGQVVRGSTPAEFATAIEEQRAQIEAIVRRIGTAR